MTELINSFRDCCNNAGEVWKFSNGKLHREFGLGDFLANSLADDDDARTIAVKALQFFCEDANEKQDIFRFAVLAVCTFLNERIAKRRGLPARAMQDLVAILKAGLVEDTIRDWISSHFG